MVLAFFCGQDLLEYFTHKYLIFLPKVPHPNKLSEFRPISLRKFTNKVISKLIYLKIAPILPNIISTNQYGFVRGRNIAQNIMLAQDIISNIKKLVVGGNAVIKLDMAKAYERVSWSYTCLVLKRFGFGEPIIDMIWRTLSNN